MSDQQRGMKMIEQEEMYLFLDAYEASLGETLRIRSASERPDFICERENGRVIGVELTKVMRDPQDALSGRSVWRREFMEPYDAAEGIANAILQKEGKRGAGNWACSGDTILVLQMCDCPLRELAWLLDDLGSGEFGPHGFAEIFLADDSELDAYGQVELFGIYPAERWGFYQRDRGKPYG